MGKKFWAARQNNKVMDLYLTLVTPQYQFARRTSKASQLGQLSLLQVKHRVMAVTLKSALAKQLALSAVLACTLFRIAVREQAHTSKAFACICFL